MRRSRWPRRMWSGPRPNWQPGDPRARKKVWLPIHLDSSPWASSRRWPRSMTAACSRSCGKSASWGNSGHEPVTQLLGGLLCGAWNNHKRKPQPEHRLYGVYTISDVWTFVQATISSLDSERPVITTAASGDYAEKPDAATIVLLLKS